MEGEQTVVPQDCQRGGPLVCQEVTGGDMLL